MNNLVSYSFRGSNEVAGRHLLFVYSIVLLFFAPLYFANYILMCLDLPPAGTDGVY